MSSAKYSLSPCQLVESTRIIKLILKFILTTDVAVIPDIPPTKKFVKI